MREEILRNLQTFFYCTKRRCLEIKPKLKVEMGGKRPKSLVGSVSSRICPSLMKTTLVSYAILIYVYRGGGDLEECIYVNGVKHGKATYTWKAGHK